MYIRSHNNTGIFFLIILFFIVSYGPFQILAEREGPVRIMLQWYPQSQFAGFIMAYEKGFFQEYDLDIELIFYSDAGSTLDKLSKGNIDFATAWLSQAITHRSEGNDIVNVFQLLKKSSLMLITKSDYGIIHPKDLNKRCISVWGGDFSIQPNAFFKKFDIEAELIPQTFTTEVFLSGACEVISAMYYNEYNKIYQAGIDREDLVTFFFSDYGLNFPEDGLYCNLEFFNGNREIVYSVVRALLAGWEYAFNNKEETIEIIIDYSRRYHLRTNKAHQDWMLRYIKKSFLYNTEEDIDSWVKLCEKQYYNVLDILIQKEIIDKPIEYEDFFMDSGYEKE